MKTSKMKLFPVCLNCNKPAPECKCSPEAIEEVKAGFRSGKYRWDESDEKEYQRAAQKGTSNE